MMAVSQMLFESAHQIALHTAKLIEDGATLQISLGSTPNALRLALSEKNDLGIHTQFLSDSIMNLSGNPFPYLFFG